MRCCWLLAMGLAIGPMGLRDAAADEPAATAWRKAGSAQVDGGDGPQATLSALSTAVKMPSKRRHAANSDPTNEGRPAPIVRLAKRSPYAEPVSTSEETLPDALAARLVSHTEAMPEPVASIPDAASESNRSAVRPADAWTPTEVGDVEDDFKASSSSISLKVSSPNRQSSRAVRFRDEAANPLREAPNSTLTSPGLVNPLR